MVRQSERHVVPAARRCPEDEELDEDPRRRRAAADIDDGHAGWDEAPRPPKGGNVFFCACQRFDEDDGGPGDDLLSLLGYGGQLGCCGAGSEDVPITGEAEEVASLAVDMEYDATHDSGDVAPVALEPRRPAPLLLAEGPPRPFSVDERAAAVKIFESYCDFFEHIAFRKGWKRPPFSRRDAEPLFREAARVVAQIRSRNLRQDGFVVRQRDGSARDWMHDAPDPKDSPAAFARGLVHATFQDASGYVEGLDAPTVERLRRRYAAEAPLPPPPSPPPERRRATSGAARTPSPSNSKRGATAPSADAAASLAARYRGLNRARSL